MSRPYLTQPSRVVSHVRKARNLARAAAVVVATPGPVFVPAEVEAARLAKCAACPEGRWHPEGNAGLGECRHPACGCTSYKLKFAALACPLDPPVWGAWKPEGAQ
jgi:hypothetical protein